jgi:hypothetical protein
VKRTDELLVLFEVLIEIFRAFKSSFEKRFAEAVCLKHVSHCCVCSYCTPTSLCEVMALRGCQQWELVYKAGDLPANCNRDQFLCCYLSCL